MNINKAIKGMISTVALMAVAASAAMAQQTTFASASGVGNNASTVFTYSGGPNGTFSTSGGALFSSVFSQTGAQTLPATLTFMGFSASGMTTGSGTTADPFTQGLGAGTFTLTGGGNTLLTGSFTSGNILTAVTNSTTAAITNTVNNVTYTGGTYFASAGLVNPGSFAISMTSVAPAPTVSGGYLTGFQAGGSVNFSATRPPATVPEPAALVPFALGGLGLLGLMARKTRRNSSAAA